MKNRTLNEIRQSKEYQTAKQTVGKYEDCTGDVKSHASVALQELKGENFYRNPFSHANVDKTVKVIVENLKNEMFDIIFEAVNDEMHKYTVFQEQTYLTDEGMDIFEEQWFEFYHEHHGEILGKIMKTLTN